MTKLQDALLNTEETYRALQPFASVEELNANTTAIRAEYGKELTRSTYDVLDVLHRYSCKFPGVFYMSKAKVASLLGITRQTVIRACNTLEGLGIIAQISTKRKGGDKRQSSNAIVFRKFISVETADITPDVTPGCYAIDTPLDAPQKTKTLYTDDTGACASAKDGSQEKGEVKSESPIDPDAIENLAPSLPDGWYEVASPYAADFNDLYAITGALFKGKHGTTLRVEDYVEEFGAVLRKAWIGLKHGRVAASKWHAYLYAGFKSRATALQAQLDRAPLIRDIAAMFDPGYVSQPACGINTTMDAWTALMD